MKNAAMNNQIYSIEDEANRLDLVSCKLRLLSTLLVENMYIGLTEEYSLGLASILNDAHKEITDVRDRLRKISK